MTWVPFFISTLSQLLWKGLTEKHLRPILHAFSFRWEKENCRQDTRKLEQWWFTGPLEQKKLFSKFYQRFLDSISSSSRYAVLISGTNWSRFWVLWSTWQWNATTVEGSRTSTTVVYWEPYSQKDWQGMITDFLLMLNYLKQKSQSATKSYTCKDNFEHTY